MKDIQTLYQEAIKFAAERHGTQTVKGSSNPYVVHLSNVAMELFVAHSHSPDFDLPFSIVVALLHDLVEDTSTTVQEIESRFGAETADAVWALTKDCNLPKEERMTDSLAKIKKRRKEVWAVKLADRITNLQPPPHDWTADHIAEYREVSREILTTLAGGNLYLAERLRGKIEEYQR